MKRVLLATFVACVSMSGSSVLAQTPTPPKPLKVRVFNYPDYLEPGGKKKDALAHDFGVGAYDLKTVKYGGVDWNNRITSIKVPKGLYVTLFRKIYEGKSLTLDANEDKLDKTFNNEVSSMVVTTEGTPELDKVQLVGTKHKLTVAELTDQLKKDKRKLVAKDTLGKDECTVVYPNASATNLSANMGGLVCSVSIDGSTKVTVVPVFGGCDVVSLQKGAGSACEIGVLATSLTVAGQKFTVRGPAAKYCGKVSQEATCLTVGATVADASVSLTDGDGNGIGVGVSVGVGAGISGGEKNGVVSAALDFKLGIGVSVNLSINYKKDGKAIYRVGKMGYVTVEHGIKGAGSYLLNAFHDDKALKGVRKIDDALIGTFREGGKLVVKGRSVAKDGAEVVADLGKKGWSALSDVGDLFDW